MDEDVCLEFLVCVYYCASLVVSGREPVRDKYSVGNWGSELSKIHCPGETVP